MKMNQRPPMKGPPRAGHKSEADDAPAQGATRAMVATRVARRSEPVTFQRVARRRLPPSSGKAGEEVEDREDEVQEAQVLGHHRDLEAQPEPGPRRRSVEEGREERRRRAGPTPAMMNSSPGVSGSRVGPGHPSEDEEGDPSTSIPLAGRHEGVRQLVEEREAKKRKPPDQPHHQVGD
jgi:hypothetical protein